MGLQLSGTRIGTSVSPWNIPHCWGGEALFSATSPALALTPAALEGAPLMLR